MLESFIKVLDYSYMQNAFAHMGYKFFDEGDLNLNIFGIRSTARQANSFDDLVGVAYKENDKPITFIMQATTDPGAFWLQNPLNNKGCAILKEGQYLGAYQLGSHRGEYEALVQRKPVVVYRDPNKDLLLDKSELRTDKGMYGINIHRSHPSVEVSQVNKYSAGCQVIQDPKDYKKFMAIVNKAKIMRENVFSYTLFNQKDLSL